MPLASSLERLHVDLFVTFINSNEHIGALFFSVICNDSFDRNYVCIIESVVKSVVKMRVKTENFGWF